MFFCNSQHIIIKLIHLLCGLALFCILGNNSYYDSATERSERGQPFFYFGYD